jgi:hypothetical protein
MNRAMQDLMGARICYSSLPMVTNRNSTIRKLLTIQLQILIWSILKRKIKNPESVTIIFRSKQSTKDTQAQRGYGKIINLNKQAYSCF